MRGCSLRWLHPLSDMRVNTTTERTASANDRDTFSDMQRGLLVNGLYIFPNPSTQVNGHLPHEAGHVHRGATLLFVKGIRRPAFCSHYLASFDVQVSTPVIPYFEHISLRCTAPRPTG